MEIVQLPFLGGTSVLRPGSRLFSSEESDCYFAVYAWRVLSKLFFAGASIEYQRFLLCQGQCPSGLRGAEKNRNRPQGLRRRLLWRRLPGKRCSELGREATVIS